MDKIEEVLNRGVEKVYPTKEALEKLLRSGKKIRLYQGFDPSMPNLHLGNYVGLIKLKQFQDLGHEVIFLIGDFTGMIGDPTDKSASRPRLTREQTLQNAKNWKEQASRVLKFNGTNPAKILFNSKWLDKVSFKYLIEIASNFTVQQLLERDFFQKRLKEEKPIYLHEFLYPIAQAVDSVEMDVDLEVGGNDQTFNMLAGRTLLGALKNKEKYVLTTKLLVDAEGTKVGKTTGNALFLNFNPIEMYGSIMSFPDEVIVLGFELLTLVPVEKIDEYKQALQLNKVNPMNLKKDLASEIVKINYGETSAVTARKEFESVFQQHETPNETLTCIATPEELSGVSLVNFLVNHGLLPSRSEAKRLIEQGGVDLNSETVSGIGFHLIPTEGMIIKLGKRKFVKINTH